LPLLVLVAVLLNCCLITTAIAGKLALQSIVFYCSRSSINSTLGNCP
jgi:hypothetical protein